MWESHKAYIDDLENRLAEAEANELYELALETGQSVEELRRELGRAKGVAFTEMSKARHATALAKIPHVIEHLKDCLENGPVVFFAHHKDVIAAINEAFPDAVKITGDVGMEDRQTAVDAFQAGKTNLFLGNILAAGVGITLTASAHVVFGELDWVPGNMSQAEDRCHRIGQEQSVLVQHLVLEGSLDADMAKKLIKKQAVIDAALDSKHAVDFGTDGPDAVSVAQVAVEVPVAKVVEEAAKLTATQVEAVHRGLRMLAGVCDGAARLDGCGFNKMDANIGHSMANQASLSNRQAVLGMKLVNKYRRQLPAELLTQAKGA